MTHRLRPHLALPILALSCAAGTFLFAALLGVPVRDPDQVIGSKFWLVPVAMAVLWTADIVPRAVARRGWRPRAWPDGFREVVRERWTIRRVGLMLVAIISFYVVYLAYRNVKSFLPLARPESFDAFLLDLDRALFFGHDPATLLHDLLGTGLAAHVMSSAYLFFLSFIPISLGLALVWSRDPRPGLWYVTALSFNWVLGIVSYYLIPAFGPIYVAPFLFDELPYTGASRLQELLASDRLAFLITPEASEQAQSIAAFASLHVSIVFTAALIARLLRLPRALEVGLWVFFGLTVLSTVYLGWHYVVDDVAGVVLGAGAVYLGARATGYPLHPLDRVREWTLRARRLPGRQTA